MPECSQYKIVQCDKWFPNNIAHQLLAVLYNLLLSNALNVSIRLKQFLSKAITCPENVTTLHESKASVTNWNRLR